MAVLNRTNRSRDRGCETHDEYQSFVGDYLLHMLIRQMMTGRD
uniref:Uncharacterized protein n=1 Tax=Pseudomonas aeruginosa TaxID=287 RepID=A0A2L1KIY6_PSEAI|nr:Hypothetical protein [Pseudomonas aeruginosa]AVE21848.1 Hypothetical protein [Pseudomonas aeruginosa]AVE22304.1 Hypothetical protein [Pseudomonas aeruginosa]QFX78303.1 hypothetical protein pNK546KPC_0093 [Pseudomonas aeruginosa]